MKRSGKSWGVQASGGLLSNYRFRREGFQKFAKSNFDFTFHQLIRNWRPDLTTICFSRSITTLRKPTAILESQTLSRQIFRIGDFIRSYLLLNLTNLQSLTVLPCLTSSPNLLGLFPLTLKIGRLVVSYTIRSSIGEDIGQLVKYIIMIIAVISLAPMTLSAKWWPVRNQPEGYICRRSPFCQNTKIEACEALVDRPNFRY